jgi:hypothetical protein
MPERSLFKATAKIAIVVAGDSGDAGVSASLQAPIG